MYNILFRNNVNFSLDKKIFEYRNTFFAKNNTRKNLKTSQFYRSESIVIY